MLFVLCFRIIWFWLVAVCLGFAGVLVVLVVIGFGAGLLVSKWSVCFWLVNDCLVVVVWCSCVTSVVFYVFVWFCLGWGLVGLGICILVSGVWLLFGLWLLRCRLVVGFCFGVGGCGLIVVCCCVRFGWWVWCCLWVLVGVFLGCFQRAFVVGFR